MRNIVRRPRAKQDIKKIWHYSNKKWGKEQADRYTQALGNAIAGLVETPNMGISIDYVREGYRQYHFKHHLIIYRVSPATIEIVRILGERMDVKRHSL